MTPEQLMKALHDSEINGEIKWFFDDIWDWGLGAHGFVAEGTENSLEGALAALAAAARKHYPDSEFAKKLQTLQQEGTE